MGASWWRQPTQTSHVELVICISPFLPSGFPDSLFGKESACKKKKKESACNAGDHGSIPGLRRSAGKGIGYLLQYSYAFFVAQLVKNPPTMWDTWVQSLGWEDPLVKGKATHSSILAWRISVHWVTKNWTGPSNFCFHFSFPLLQIDCIFPLSSNFT